MRYMYLLLGLFFTLSVYSSPATDNNKWKVLNEKNETLQKKLKSCESVLNKLKDKQRYNELHYCPRDSFNISKSNNLIVTHQN